MESDNLNFGSPQVTDPACQRASTGEDTPVGSITGEEALSSVTPACGCAGAGHGAHDQQNQAAPQSRSDNDALSSVAPACGCRCAGASNEAHDQQNQAARPSPGGKPFRAQEAAGDHSMAGGVASSSLGQGTVGFMPGRHEPGILAANGQGAARPTSSLVYAIGRINYDFGTEARRDSFRQQMGFSVAPQPDEEGRPVYSEANPYDVKQMREYLATNPWASDKLTWTLEVGRTPILALKAEQPFGMDWGGPFEDHSLRSAPDTPQRSSEGYYPPVSRVYKLFRDALVLQANQQPLQDLELAPGLPAAQRPGTGEEIDGNHAARAVEYVSRVSIPGVLTGKTVRTFTGQLIPEVEVDARGVAMWNETLLVNKVVDTVRSRGATVAIPDLQLKMTLRTLLDKFYFQFQNLGQTSADRALNYIGTNAYTIASTVAEGILSASYVPGVDNTHAYTVDTVTVRKSSFERMDSDCHDVIVRFIDPENDRRAAVSYLFVVDVNEVIPVTVAPVYRFLGDI
ncbi:hypothetical protein ACIRP3_43265 [Streptomyces sp. NPDC101209]|uniref:cyanobactin maturation protease PatG family protein n=1 Tax=Streptomyces sp. NPDC101209 TaxID=3366129 RepID=UPI0038049106